jgi:hypothetical protein
MHQAANWFIRFGNKAENMISLVHFGATEKPLSAHFASQRKLQTCCGAIDYVFLGSSMSTMTRPRVVVVCKIGCSALRRNNNKNEAIDAPE